ncbi:MAG: hypothetical protein E6J89_11375 [Deltaproteobacteria bacterium]|nr:MAG: hypothetical protein E6J89_11375 [Deltaproteobacteria bacterium]
MEESKVQDGREIERRNLWSEDDSRDRNNFGNRKTDLCRFLYFGKILGWLRKKGFVFDQHGFPKVVSFCLGQTMALGVVELHILVQSRRSHIVASGKTNGEESEAEEKKEANGPYCLIGDGHGEAFEV